METNWAAEHLQVIRTLMERSAVYRRALAPIMIVTGSLGVCAAVVSCFVKIEANRAFSLFWISVSLVAGVASFLLIRRQAVKDAEPFWSPPTRRVSQAVLPAFLIGLVCGLVFGLAGDTLPRAAWLLALGWTVIYGCALHAAGFFMERGIRLFAWAFVIGGLLTLGASLVWSHLQTSEAGHYVMGVFFGAFHLAYGVYLYFTEKRRQAA